jgi:hypothetical protein
MHRPNILDWQHLNQHPNCWDGCHYNDRADNAGQKASLAWTNLQRYDRDRHGRDCGNKALDD